MRRFFLLAAAVAALMAVSEAALAQVLTLQAAVELRVRPTRKCPVTVIAPPDTQVTVLEAGRDWVRVTLDGAPYYAAAGAIANATPAPAPGPDPTCDYGYPYSGSGIFFANPLTQFRHGPLGFLLGTHRFYPC
jgi:hypothetical protein